MSPLLIHFVSDGVEYVAVSSATLNSLSPFKSSVRLCSEQLTTDWGLQTPAQCRFFNNLTQVFGNKGHRYKRVLCDSDFDSIALALEFLSRPAQYRSPTHDNLPQF